VLVLLGGVFGLAGMIMVILAVRGFTARYCAPIPDNLYCQIRAWLT
jgi:hypothetical protein